MRVYASVAGLNDTGEQCRPGEVARLLSSSTSASPAFYLLCIARSFQRLCTLPKHHLSSAAILLFGLRLLLRVKFVYSDGYCRYSLR